MEIRSKKMQQNSVQRTKCNTVRIIHKHQTVSWLGSSPAEEVLEHRGMGGIRNRKQINNAKLQRKKECNETYKHFSCLLSNSKKVALSETLNTQWAIRFKKYVDNLNTREKQGNGMSESKHKGKNKKIKIKHRRRKNFKYNKQLLQNEGHKMTSMTAGNGIENSGLELLQEHFSQRL